MHTIQLGLPESLHQADRRLAEREQIALDQLTTLALVERVTTFLAEDYLRRFGDEPPAAQPAEGMTENRLD